MNNPNLPVQKKGVTRVGSGDLLGHGVIGTISIISDGKYEVMAINKGSLRQVRAIQNLKKRRPDSRVINSVINYRTVDGLMIKVSHFVCELRSLVCPNKVVKLSLFINSKTGCVAHCDKGIRDTANSSNRKFRGTMTRIVRHKREWPNEKS